MSGDDDTLAGLDGGGNGVVPVGQEALDGVGQRLGLGQQAGVQIGVPPVLAWRGDITRMCTLKLVTTHTHHRTRTRTCGE